MNAFQIEALAPTFTRFLQQFESFFAHPGTVKHFRNYTRGLLTDLERKTAEPLAKYAGTAPRSLQQFLKACLWDQQGLTDAVQQTLRLAVADLPPDPVGTVGIVDETSVLKQGNKTPGVQRQYLGSEGKVDNGIVTVHVAVTHGSFKALLDSELFLPKLWAEDRERCREADIPEDLPYQPKWRIALNLLARSERNGWRFDWLTFDEGYGSKPEFLKVLDVAGQRYVGEVPRTFSCQPKGRKTALSAEAVFAQAEVKERSAKTFQLQHQTGSATVWQAKEVKVALGRDRHPGHRLILARNRETGERKYFLTNAPKGISLHKVLQAGFVRWNVEHVFRVAKSEVGLTHFEGQSYVSLKRHLTLCLVALAFVSMHTQELRGEKSGGDAGATMPGIGAGLSEIPEAESRHQRNGMSGRPDSVSSATQPDRQPISQKTTKKA